VDGCPQGRHDYEKKSEPDEVVGCPTAILGRIAIVAVTYRRGALATSLLWPEA